MAGTIDKLLENVSFSELNIQPDNTKPPQILEIAKLPVKSGAVILVKLFEGRDYGPHIHEKSDESIYIISGRGRIFCNSTWFHYDKNSHFYVPRLDAHRFEVYTRTYLFSVQDTDVVGDGKLDIK